MKIGICAGDTMLICAPLRGEDSIIPEDPYQAILNGAGKDDPDSYLL